VEGGDCEHARSGFENGTVGAWEKQGRIRGSVTEPSPWKGKKRKKPSKRGVKGGPGCVKDDGEGHGKRAIWGDLVSSEGHSSGPAPKYRGGRKPRGEGKQLGFARVSPKYGLCWKGKKESGRATKRNQKAGPGGGLEGRQIERKTAKGGKKSTKRSRREGSVGKEFLRGPATQVKKKKAGGREKKMTEPKGDRAFGIWRAGGGSRGWLIGSGFKLDPGPGGKEK